MTDSPTWAKALIVTVAVLKLLELLLPTKTKRKLNHVSLAFWDWLDDQAHAGFVRSLWHIVLQIPLFIVGGTFAVFVNVTALPLAILPVGASQGWLILLVAVVTVLGVALLYKDHRGVYQFLLSARDTRDYFNRLMSFVVGYGWPWPAVYAFFTWPQNSPAAGAYQLAALVTSPRRFLHSTALAVIAIESLVWLGIIRVLQGITYMLAYVLRRVVEHEKGVLVGVAMLLAAFADVLW